MTSTKVPPTLRSYSPKVSINECWNLGCILQKIQDKQSKLKSGRAKQQWNRRAIFPQAVRKQAGVWSQSLSTSLETQHCLSTVGMKSSFPGELPVVTETSGYIFQWPVEGRPFSHKSMSNSNVTRSSDSFLKSTALFFLRLNAFLSVLSVCMQWWGN